MITVGPVSVVAGQTINETDPDRFGGGSNKVQILNLSGLLLTVTIGDTQAPIPPFQAVTLATMFNVPLVVVTQATGYTARGSVTFYWLLEKEQSPVRDGPQTAALSNYTAGNVTGPTTSAVPVRTIPLTGVPFLATTAIITFNYTQDLSNNDTSPITVTGDQSGKTLYSVPLSNFTVGNQYQITVPLDQGFDTSLHLNGFQWWINSGNSQNISSLSNVTVQYHD